MDTTEIVCDLPLSKSERKEVRRGRLVIVLADNIPGYLGNLLPPVIDPREILTACIGTPKALEPLGYDTLPNNGRLLRLLVASHDSYADAQSHLGSLTGQPVLSLPRAVQ